MKKLLQELRAGIGYSSRPLTELLLEQDGSPFCREAAKQKSFSEDPVRALELAGDALFFREKDRALFRGFAQGLGSSGTASQLEHIDLYAAMLEPHLQEARSDREKKARLYVSLGLFAGIAACLVLL